MLVLKGKDSGRATLVLGDGGKIVLQPPAQSPQPPGPNDGRPRQPGQARRSMLPTKPGASGKKKDTDKGGDDPHPPVRPAQGSARRGSLLGAAHAAKALAADGGAPNADEPPPPRDPNRKTMRSSTVNFTPVM